MLNLAILCSKRAPAIDAVLPHAAYDDRGVHDLPFVLTANRQPPTANPVP
jgi:hypothetical protein